MCKVEEDCTEAARCDGTAAMCPNPAPKPDNVTECNEGTQVSSHGSDPGLVANSMQCYELFYNTRTVRPINTICVDSIEDKRKRNSETYIYSFYFRFVKRENALTQSV